MNEPKHGRLIIDADILLWQHSSSAVTEVVFEYGTKTWGPPRYVASRHANVGLACHNFDTAVLRLEEALGAEEVLLTLTCPDSNFRHLIMPTYKSHRGGPLGKPVGYWKLREYVEDKYDTWTIPSLEGDDLCGLALTDPHYPGTQVVASIDKDMKTLPGLHYNWTTRQLARVSEEEADRFHLWQTLVGDTTDGYPGCRGIGAISVEKLFDKQGCSWPTVTRAFAKAEPATLSDEVRAFEGELKALANARVARILRYGDYDDDGVRLWSPPSEEETE